MEYTAHPAGVPPRPAWTGVGPRVAGASTLIDPAEAVVEHLRPLQSRYAEIIGDSGELERVMARGAEDASAVADATLDGGRQAMGFVPRPRRN